MKPIGLGQLGREEPRVPYPVHGKGRRQQPSRPPQRLVRVIWRGPEEQFGQEYGNHDYRRTQRALERRSLKRTERKTAETSDIPPGSQLSDRTVADIAAGNYTVVRPALVNDSPAYSVQDKKRRSRKTAKLSRRRNRKAQRR